MMKLESFKFLASFATLLLLVVGASYLQHGYPTTKTKLDWDGKRVTVASKRAGEPPVLAYWIHGSSGDGERIMRVLKASYHPRNQYLLLLDASSSSDERRNLALSVQSNPLFAVFNNVNVVGRSYAVNQMGGSGLAALLHASALLLKISTTWDWFITLGASDYPLMTQDDILHAFTLLPRDLNFIHFANNTSGSNENTERVKQVVVDPSIYNRKDSPIFYARETRDAPNTFKIVAGSPWVILSRSLVEFVVKGWDNFPRKLLMYMSNVASPLEFYFQTVICNSPSFQNTTVDNDLRYFMSKNESLEGLNYKMVGNFKKEDDHVLMQEVDKKILKRSGNGVVPGKWCFWRNDSRVDDDGNWDINSVEATPRGVKMGATLSRLATQTHIITCPTILNN
ncbi:beta-glucuronosyltransferase GlcAT14B-like [Cynara cardunculus var. scolymus]|uniref:Glycosyl transferase, family 14 n=1 Tax=Cynara cardunculus var. scolymus TaxID=59895 RepID=A0A103XW26_CYNCS|nr:beta-glucuronosyltransferase GlcAT14B-like [Cynara cardunculus var. scolymus]KVH97933.1 Glycosyl transferase, family 14 [Cynara cardunculus var. scolymus]